MQRGIDKLKSIWKFVTNVTIALEVGRPLISDFNDVSSLQTHLSDNSIKIWRTKQFKNKLPEENSSYG